MARQYKSYEEKFLGFILKPVLGDTDEDGFAAPVEWTALKGGEVVRSDRSVTLVRRWCRKQAPKTKTEPKVVSEAEVKSFPKTKQTKPKGAVKKRSAKPKHTFPQPAPEA